MANHHERQPQITYHLVAKEEFSDERRVYAPRKFASEGFVHTTRRREHVHEVANRYMRNDLRPHLVLTIDLNRFPGMWRYDAPNDEYPHLYAPIPQEAILQVEEALRNSEGEFQPLST